MGDLHQPAIRTHNGWWVVDCPECQQAVQSTYEGYVELPIGIGMPLKSRLTAERLQENHMGR